MCAAESVEGFESACNFYWYDWNEFLAAGLEMDVWGTLCLLVRALSHNEFEHDWSGTS